jgi:hypothetical protein
MILPLSLIVFYGSPSARVYVLVIVGLGKFLSLAISKTHNVFT